MRDFFYVLRVISAQAVVISSALAGFFFSIYFELCLQSVVISSAHAGNFFKYVVLCLHRQ
jgi:hypothetical protein